MRIKFTDSNTAILTKGWWFFKYRAEVYRHGSGGSWFYRDTGEKVSGWIDFRLDIAAYSRTHKSAWVRVRALPAARIVPKPGQEPNERS